jgi:GT2 family glycosyltransferase
MKITTIVVNWNLKEVTARCLESLDRSAMPCKTIVVDNGSQDGSAIELRGRFPGVEVIALPQNLGFGGACNIAIRQALQDPGCEYVFLLNNDATLHENTLGNLARMAESHPGAAILGPKIYYRQAEDKIWYAGSKRRWGVLAATVPGRRQSDRGQFELPGEVDYVFGAAMFIRRQVFEDIGLFDERYFLYLEDLDFCLRAQAAGYGLLFVPQSHVWHIGSASTAGNLALRRYHHVRSSILFLRKHASLLAILPAAIFWCGVLLRMIALDLLDGNLHLVRSYGSALVHGVQMRRAIGERATSRASSIHQG